MTQLAFLSCGRCYGDIAQNQQHECPSCHDFFHASCLKLHTRTCEIKQKLRLIPKLDLKPTARLWKARRPW
jgi:hypothetical protein